MATVSKKLADEIVAGKYDDDRPVKIVEYDNAWGGIGYGVIFYGEHLDKYRETGFVRKPRTYWEKK